MDEPQAFPRYPVKGRGLDDRVSVGPGVCPGLIIGDAKENVGTFSESRAMEPDQQGYGRKQWFHHYSIG